jgi:hypothetical protein
MRRVFLEVIIVWFRALRPNLPKAGLARKALKTNVESKEPKDHSSPRGGSFWESLWEAFWEAHEEASSERPLKNTSGRPLPRDL